MEKDSFERFVTAFPLCRFGSQTIAFVKAQQRVRKVKHGKSWHRWTTEWKEKKNDFPTAIALPEASEFKPTYGGIWLNMDQSGIDIELTNKKCKKTFENYLDWKNHLWDKTVDRDGISILTHIHTHFNNPVAKMNNLFFLKPLHSWEPFTKVLNKTALKSPRFADTNLLPSVSHITSDKWERICSAEPHKCSTKH